MNIKQREETKRVRLTGAHRLPHKVSIDIGLAVLRVINRGGCHRILELAEIAEVCGCSKQLIHRIEKEALAKLRRLLITEYEKSKAEERGEI